MENDRKILKRSGGTRYNRVMPRHLVLNDVYISRGSFSSIWKQIKTNFRRGTYNRAVKRKPMLSDRERMAYTFSNLLEEFFDVMITDVIMNNVIFAFPRNYAFIFVCRYDSSYKDWSYDMRKGHGGVAIVFYQPKNQIRYKFKRRVIYLTKKYYKMLNSEIDNGHMYPSYSEVIDQIYKYHGNR